MLPVTNVPILGKPKVHYRAYSTLQLHRINLMWNFPPNISNYRLILSSHPRLVAGIAQSVQRPATGWTVRASNAGGGEIFRTGPDRPWGPPGLLYNGYRVFPGGKATGAWC